MPRQTRPANRSSRPILIPTRPPVVAVLRSGPSLLAKGAMTAFVALVNSMIPGAARAQSSEPPSSIPVTTLPEVEVTGSDDYRAEFLSLPKYTQPILTTPQSVSVVTPKLRQDEAVTSFSDALRNVSGISLGAGEGSYQGDNYSIRGFAGRSDTFIDGMRDFGDYFRDPFDTENIEVLKGASSTEFGRGSTGGVVNIETKQPELLGFTAGSVVYGTDNTKRAILDFDQPIPSLRGAAFRLNLMGNNSDVTDRDYIHYDRWGIAPSLALGLGTDTRILLDYFHQSESDTPDYGIPYYFGQPAPVDRSNYYGFEDDFFRANVNIGTLILEHDFNENLTLHEELRLASYHRGLRVTEADIPDDVTRDTPLSSIRIERNPIDGISTERDIDEDINLAWKAGSGFFRNTLVSGFEYVRQFSDPRRFEPSWTDVPGTSLLNPDEGLAFSGRGELSTLVNGSLDQYSGYLTDTLKLGSKWSCIAGFRYDAVSSSYSESIPPTSAFDASAEAPSWRGAVVYQPAPNGSIYFSAGTSFHPNAEQVSVVNETTLPEKFKDLPVGHNLDIEIGTKWDLFDNRLSFSTALFWEEQTNPATEDADDDLLYVTNGRERVIGAEFGIVGQITADWRVLLNYTYEKGTVVSSSQANLVGNPILNAPKSTLALWTTYDLPWNLEVGFGLNEVSSRVAAESPDAPGEPLRGAPGYVIMSALLKYQINPHVDIQANLTNLADQPYFDGVHPGHVVPGEGRTLFLSTNFKF